MSRYCVLRTCRELVAQSIINQEKIYSHRFPRLESLKQKWELFVNQANRTTNFTATTQCVCSRHFTPSCYIREGRLYRDAIPTIADRFTAVVAYKHNLIHNLNDYEKLQKINDFSNTVIRLRDTIHLEKTSDFLKSVVRLRNSKPLETDNDFFSPAVHLQNCETSGNSIFFAEVLVTEDSPSSHDGVNVPLAYCETVDNGSEEDPLEIKDCHTSCSESDSLENSLTGSVPITKPVETACQGISTSNREENKLKRRVTVGEKLAVLQRLENGEKIMRLAAELRVSEQSVRTWKRQKTQLEKVNCNNSKRVSCKDYSHAITLRNKVYEWFCSERDKGIPLPQALISAKAIELNRSLGGPSYFRASNGWIDNFKKHIQRRLTTPSRKAGAADYAAEAYRKSFFKLITERGLTEDQIYNADETGLYIKCLPPRTLEAARGLNQAKERLTLLVCSNASGQHKLPLLIIGRSESCRVFSKVNRDQLPAVYTHSSKAWMTAKIFEAWVRGQFEPKVRAFLAAKKLPPKAVLLVDNASSHHISNFTVGVVKIELLPPNITSLVQPLDQGAISLLKRTYRTELLSRLVNSTDVKRELKSINTLVALKLAIKAWDSVRPETLAKCWKPLGLNADLSGVHTVSETQFQMETTILQHASSITGLENLTREDITEWCNSDPKEVNCDISPTEYELLNPNKVRESEVEASISHEEGAAVLEQAILYLKQTSKNDLIGKLTDIRNEALSLIS